MPHLRASFLAEGAAIYLLSLIVGIVTVIIDELLGLNP
jgi:hypothetical protein